MQAYQLYSMGLIQRKRDRVIPHCQLYRQYFQRIMNYES
ncbi:AAA-like domain-containing protein [Coleofasciculus sp. G3-WIS-01]